MKILITVLLLLSSCFAVSSDLDIFRVSSEQEKAIKQNKIGKKSNKTPIAKKLQKELFLFTTNQSNQKEIDIQTEALKKTINFFKLH